MKEVEPTDFKEFYDRNEPDNAQALACLYRSVRDASDEDLELAPVPETGS
jgi:hypothetical protein